MIKILERYITKVLISATAMVGLIIVGVLFLLTLLGELKNIGEGDYGLIQAVIYVLMRLPNQLYQFSPLLILMGSITGLSILSSHRELSVMRASGFSIRRMIFSVFSAALIMIVVMTGLGEWVGPSWSNKATIQKEISQNGGQAVLTTEGVWMHIDNNFIHVQEIVNKKFLVGVTRYEFNNQHELLASYYAKRLVENNEQWQLEEVAQTSFYPSQTKSTTYPILPWHLKFNPNLLKLGDVDPTEMPLPKLMHFAQYLKENHLQDSEYQFNFWQRLLQPLASLVMIFLAIPFVLGVQHATSLGWRIIIGILAGFAFFILNAFLGQLSIVYQIPPPIAAFSPILLFILLSLFLTKKLIVR